MEKERDDPENELDHEGFDVWMPVEEKAKARRMRLYQTLKAHDNLGLYYYLYPDEKPKGFGKQPGQSRDDDGRER